MPSHHIGIGTLSNSSYVELYKAALIPLYVSLSALVCVIQDYFITVENEIMHIWVRLNNFSLYHFGKRKTALTATEDELRKGNLPLGLFMWLLICDTLQRGKVIGVPQNGPSVGCHPTLNKGLQWELWLPATLFELLLFSQALYKTVISTSIRIRLNKRISLAQFLLQDSLMYFFVWRCVIADFEHGGNWKQSYTMDRFWSIPRRYWHRNLEDDD
ncbi:hypothetical protein CVT24_004864 [Panaeolus cyanescens]|uniref:DUF6533 domain-containing protein n=1 Tax=Panaeolus cyanescens TaxID=181874 RepID=A0A409VEI4_9AGAR|nr:hypothetical protein CVT24_004864 [Panaeolus cyanescens]